jgi:hypothetical protein
MRSRNNSEIAAVLRGYNRQHANSCAVIDGSVLINSRHDFAGIHLNALTGDEPGVPSPTLSRAAGPRQRFDVHGLQDLVDCGAGYVEIVSALQFTLNPSGPQIAVAQLANPCAMLIKSFCRR